MFGWRMQNPNKVAELAELAILTGLKRATSFFFRFFRQFLVEKDFCANFIDLYILVELCLFYKNLLRFICVPCKFEYDSTTTNM